MSIAAALKEQITDTGPLTIAAFMECCNTHYYVENTPFGTEGDFITAPEISQVFGELIGIWCVQQWQALGAPSALHLVECGPGRGTLMHDLLRGTQHISGFHQSLTIHLVENSPTLQEEQRTLLQGTDIPIQWHDSIDSIPPGPALIVANEFFDALPTHQFQYTKDRWQERSVTYDEGQFCFTLSQPFISIPEDLPPVEEGAILEISPAREAVIQCCAHHLAEHGGAALIIDYGYTAPPLVDTLQAVRQHRYHPVLEAPGAADLTTHVDFTALKNVVEQAGCRAYGTITQADFLTQMGIELRMQQLAQQASPQQKQALAAALKRLTHPEQMGTLFRCLAITNMDMPAPYAFTE